MPSVLIVNDDGIESQGLRVLAEAFDAAGWRVTVVAPLHQRSGCSQAITIHSVMICARRDWGGIRAYCLDAMPADCTKIGLDAIAPDVDLVVSGINEGANLGMDTCNSGTVGGAMMAVLEGKPALAVSIGGLDNTHHKTAAERAVRAAVWLLKNPLPVGYMLNMNVPDLPESCIQGQKWCALSGRHFTFQAAAYDLPGGDTGYCYGFAASEGTPDVDSDVDWFRRGYVTFAALRWDMGVSDVHDRALPE